MSGKRPIGHFAGDFSGPTPLRPYRWLPIGPTLGLLLLVSLGGWGACSGRGRDATANVPPAEAQPGPPSFTLFALAEVRGQLGPCGCTSDPLGDLARTAQVINDARAKGPVLVVDAGSLLYAKANPGPAHAAQEEKKAELLVRAYQDNLKVAAIGLGPADLVAGPGNVRPARQLANATADSNVPVEAPKIVKVGDVNVGIFGVSEADAVVGVAVTDPVAAGKAAVAQLRQDGAAVIVGLLQSSSKRNVLALAKAIGGIDFAVAGLGSAAPEPDQISPRAEDLGDGTFLIVPSNRGQIISRVDVMIKNPGPFTDAVGPGAARDVATQLDRQLASLDKDLAAFAADPNADQAFVTSKKSERAAIAADKAALARMPWRMPANGSFFGFEQVKINKALGCDAAIQKATNEYNLAVGRANVAFAATQPVAKLPKSAPRYVGGEACADCHQEAVDFWKTTRHAQAWKTLEDRSQQFDLDCISCHVTGWDKPSGATMVQNEHLRDVQCETCHAPSSIHVANGGEDKPLSIMKEPPQDLCASSCHTKEHSDTFDFKPYLRDVLGPGHGENERKRLGDGPTGKSLRSAALEKAGKLLGPGCMK
ncbi:MAG: hypothetical protein KBG15_08205 [Kofleriaceae bacterium]|nr:hypothetical protein [Kofleriaceae bacterium]